MKFLLYIFLYAAPGFALAQDDLLIYQARKYVSINYGERLESESPGNSTITLNLRDSTIQINSPSPEIRNFLNGINNFRFNYMTKEHLGTRLFYTDNLVFSFNPAMRIILIRSQKIHPQMFSLKFYEIE